MNGISILGHILVSTRERLAERRRRLPLDRLMAAAPTPQGQRSFAGALARSERVNVIAEFKRRSPSGGVIREDLHPVSVAQGYEIAGAAALSVLTEERFFGGSLEDLQEARAATLLPALRKDFLVDPYQVWEAWYAGADAVLLIVAALADAELRTLHQTAREAGLDALFEVHDRGELTRALRAGARLVGVNNRDLKTMAVDLQTSFSLVREIPEDVLAVSESGIRGSDDLRRLRDAGFDAFLVGEQLMRAPDPGAALEAVLRDVSPPGAEPSALPRAPRVKICGITNVEDARLAVDAGADAIGFVLWPGSPRRVDLETARRIAAAVPPLITRVGVFVNAPAAELRGAADAIGLDLLQLHGDEPPEALAGLPRRVLKAVRVGSAQDAEGALRYEGVAAGILLDARDPAAPGGTGRRFDWTLAASLRPRCRFLALSGGLTPENVGEAIRTVQPDLVDVASGVERSPRSKDAGRVRAFVEAVKRKR